MWRDDKSNCGSCHGSGLQSYVQRKPNFDGIDIAGIASTGATNLTWEVLKRLRDTVKTKLVIKGILAEEDAGLAVDHGLDGIIVSNHGGRAEDSGRSTIDALPEILDAVDDRIPVLVDSGFRRGTDIAKALALGARGVCIGRPYLWGLGAFGQAGVERVLELLRLELRAAMMQLGAPSLKHLVPEMVRRVQ
jgi:isopentenyl diphosphate isomerase/L-lactate dehydrogenase-like FMN-dependent dehydrogenase